MPRRSRRHAQRLQRHSQADRPHERGRCLLNVGICSAKATWMIALMPARSIAADLCKSPAFPTHTSFGKTSCMVSTVIMRLFGIQESGDRGNRAGSRRFRSLTPDT
jgi:hypothetical protein